MSNDSSVTVSTASQVRQFGLYRNIDVRTEEFLRLSKKRQIKQGCVCAALSTAITVAIVVSVLLVYEYSINANLNLNNNYVKKTNWLAWINNSADIAPFEEKYSKIKFNFDKTTLKLLPMLLNALNRNIYLEKIVDEYSSSSPTYDKKDTTEFNYKIDAFKGLRNFYKMPTSRLYAIEYKTSPVVHYRSPTQSVEYFTKIRKIRDYQRIINYFDKMIGDKVGYSSAVSSMRNEIYKTKRPQRKLSTLSMKNHNNGNNVQRLVISNKGIKNIDNQQTECKCPKKLGELLTKLITSISQFIPYAKLPIALCKEEPLEKELKPLSNIANNTFPSIPQVKPLINSFTTARNKQFSTGIKEQNSVKKNKTFHFHLNSKIVKPINEEPKSASDTFIYRDKSTIMKYYIEATETEKILPTTTKPLIPVLKNINNYKHLYQATTRKEYVLNKATTESNNKIQSKVSVLDTDEYEDYFATTSDILDMHSLGLLKTKMIYPLKKIEKVKIKESSENANEKVKYNTQSSKFTMTGISQNNNYFDSKKLRTKLISKIKSTDSLLVPLKTQTGNLANTQLVKDNVFTNSAPTNIPSEIHTLDKLLNNEGIILDDDKILQEDQLRELDSTNQTINANNTVNKTEMKLSQITSNNLYTANNKLEAAILKEITKTRNHNSMLPEDRPVYLEIQRNEWKHDDHQDFDMNFNNNLFDLTNP